MPGIWESVIGGHCMWPTHTTIRGGAHDCVTLGILIGASRAAAGFPDDYLFDSDYAADFHAILAVKRVTLMLSTELSNQAGVSVILVCLLNGQGSTVVPAAHGENGHH